MLPVLSLPLAVATAVALALPVASAPPHPVLGPAPRAGLPDPPHAASRMPVWRAPLDGRIKVLRPFAPPARRWLPGHRGVDLAAGAFTLVRAAAAGVVAFAGPLAGRGVVSVDHPDGTRTTYEPVDATVSEGDPVDVGDVLGLLEPLTAHCAETCLHWGLRDGEIYLDPLSLIDRPPPVLLPYGPPVLRVGPTLSWQWPG